MPAMKGSKLPPARSPKARLPPVAIGSKQHKEKDLEGQGREKEEEEESQQHEKTTSSLPQQGEAHTEELGVQDALVHLNQVSRELRDAREMSDELLDIITRTNPTTYQEILNSTKNTKLRDIMKKAKTTTGDTTPEGFRRISALIQDNNQVLTRECHRQMASLGDERASGSSLTDAGVQAGGSGSGGDGTGGASSAPPPSLGDNGNSDHAGERVPDGEGAATLPDLALVQNMAVADALPRFVNALLHQKEQEQQQQQQSGVPKFTFGKAGSAPSSPSGRKTVATSTDDDETGGAAAAAAAAVAAATVSPARCGESYTSARRGGGGGGGGGGGVKAIPNPDGGGNFRESSGPGPQGPRCPACEEEDAAVQRGALEGCQGEGEGGTVVGSGDEEGQEKNKGQQYEEEERPAALREMETQVRKSLNVLWMSEGWDGVTRRRESATAGPLAEASRATTLGETNAAVAADRDPTPPTDIVISVGR
ncbi:expressed unknown protein [Ectocarpus siliculosus]|uniref:Uncharacterized protein n=1 Tax=Ectocarpus siliculosus TaxID=2880 RepID=D7FJY7_ECTSI|nr:expressed unknown protein [Ectocarpus siliculosus]|eukprot:CBJ49076.1 expressed unknown protein [Ectocarpus siliculosus]